MSYKIKVLTSEGREVSITAEPSGFEIAEAGGVLYLCASWDSTDLTNHREALTIQEAWPGRETVEVYGDGEESVFSGLVSGVGWRDEQTFLKARETGS